MEVVLDLEISKTYEEEKKVEKMKEVEEEQEGDYQLLERDRDALRDLVTEALAKTRKSQVFHLLLCMPLIFLIAYLIFFSSSLPSWSSSLLPTWLSTWLSPIILVTSTSTICFSASLALITHQQRVIAFGNVIERLF